MRDGRITGLYYIDTALIHLTSSATVAVAVTATVTATATATGHSYSHSSSHNSSAVLFCFALLSALLDRASSALFVHVQLQLRLQLPLQLLFLFTGINKSFLAFFFLSLLYHPLTEHDPSASSDTPARPPTESQSRASDCPQAQPTNNQPTSHNHQRLTMSRQSPPAPDDDDDHVPLDAHHPHPPSSAPLPLPPPRSPPPPDLLRRPPPSQSHQHPSLSLGPSQSSSFQPQTTHNARQQLGPVPDQRQHQQQLQQPIPHQLQPTPASPVLSYPQNRQITLEPQRPSTSSPKHQSAKGGVRGRITVVCAEVLLFPPSHSRMLLTTSIYIYKYSYIYIV